MPIAIFDPFSGISGDMTLGALLAVGLDPEWLRALPARLGLDGVTVRIADVQRSGITCKKVDFDIPPQPHGRHLRQIRQMVAAAGVPDDIALRANDAFSAIGQAEGEIHGVDPERVHLHEVGAVDAILDVVGSIWGLGQLGVTDVYCGPIALGDGTVRAAHGILPVPAPATLKLLEGHPVRPGPDGSGELVTPTGAALVRVLSAGPPPAEYIPRRSGFGAGTKEFRDRPNALRIVLADTTPSSGTGERSTELRHLAMLTADVDDMTPEQLAGAAEVLRTAGALDVVSLPAVMKKGRLGTRLEVLARPADAERLEGLMFTATTTIGVRRAAVERRALGRETRVARVLGHDVRVKVSTLPDGARRAKPEFDDVRSVATATGRSTADIASLALAEYSERAAMGEGRTTPRVGADAHAQTRGEG
jgi:pyridinium-3,5-bisthiocarboxylic acid mononucleotide nickel chelatase